MPIVENGPVTIRYEEAGAGLPLLVLPGDRMGDAEIGFPCD